MLTRVWRMCIEVGEAMKGLNAQLPVLASPNVCLDYIVGIATYQQAQLTDECSHVRCLVARDRSAEGKHAYGSRDLWI